MLKSGHKIWLEEPLTFGRRSAFLKTETENKREKWFAINTFRNGIKDSLKNIAIDASLKYPNRK